MADYDSSLPVRTEADGDVVSKIGDGTTPSQYWEILSTGEGVVTMRQNGNVMVVNADGSINANIVQGVVGDEVHVYATSSSIAPNTPTNVVNYTVTALKTLVLKHVQAACSGKCKVELKTGPTGSETTKAVGFISTASGQVEWKFAQPIEVIAGDKVLVVMTNKDNANTDLYAFINGNEV